MPAASTICISCDKICENKRLKIRENYTGVSRVNQLSPFSGKVISTICCFENVAVLQDLRPLPGFHVGQHANNHKNTAELFATIRNIECILDDVWCIWGRCIEVEATFQLKNLYEDLHSRRRLSRFKAGLATSISDI
jgi:hypothetical protein